MVRALILGVAEFAAIKAAIVRAFENPLPWGVVEVFEDQYKPVMKLEDRPIQNAKRPPSQQVLIPTGYRAAFSFEHQPSGLIRHLSVSVDTPGSLPSVPAMVAVMGAFGFSGPDEQRRIWLEEFEPGHFAINIAELVQERG